MVNSLVQKADIDLKLFPNPADNVVRVEWGKEEETGKIVLLELTGNLVSAQLPGEHNALTLDLTTVKNGVYFIQFVGTTSTKTERLVVRH
jgi:hypothetical protein